jgi:hypothetical protein
VEQTGFLIRLVCDSAIFLLFVFFFSSSRIYPYGTFFRTRSESLHHFPHLSSILSIWERARAALVESSQTNHQKSHSFKIDSQFPLIPLPSSSHLSRYSGRNIHTHTFLPFPP